MEPDIATDILALHDELDAAERDARGIVDGLTEELGTWRAAPGSWSVAECFDHLATGNRVYLAAMGPPGARALAEGRVRRGPVRPGLIGGWFARLMEPPVSTRFKQKAPEKIRPRSSPPLADAFDAFLTSQNDVRTFLRTYAGIDLSGVTFPNPFIRGVRFSLATGLHVITAHERRHLWQARRVRESAVRAGAR